MTRAANFRLADVQRAIKAVRAAGLRVYAVEIGPDGTVRVLTAKPTPPSPEEALDAWRAEKARRGSALEQWESENGLVEHAVQTRPALRKR